MLVSILCRHDTQGVFPSTGSSLSALRRLLAPEHNIAAYFYSSPLASCTRSRWTTNIRHTLHSYDKLRWWKGDCLPTCVWHCRSGRCSLGSHRMTRNGLASLQQRNSPVARTSDHSQSASVMPTAYEASPYPSRKRVPFLQKLHRHDCGQISLQASHGDSFRNERV